MAFRRIAEPGATAGDRALCSPSKLLIGANGQPTQYYRITLHSTAEPGSTLRPAGVAVAMTWHIYITDDEHRRIYLIEPHAPGGEISLKRNRALGSEA